MFKKRATKKAGIRKARSLDEDSEGEGEKTTVSLELIREMREEQKDRRRAAGVDTGKLMSASGIPAVRHGRAGTLKGGC